MLPKRRQARQIDGVALQDDLLDGGLTAADDRRLDGGYRAARKGGCAVAVIGKAKQAADQFAAGTEIGDDSKFADHAVGKPWVWNVDHGIQLHLAQDVLERRDFLH